MNRRIAALACGALAALPAAAAASAQTPDVKRMETVADSLAREMVAAGVVPGLTIAVARNGETVFARGYGKADVEMGVDAGAETVYPVTSLTKQFTAAAVLRLAEAGKLSLDDSITKHLPDYPAHARAVTVRHLLDHTSGISPMRGTSAVDDPQWFRRDLAYAEMVALFGTKPLEFGPGEKFDYNNMAYYLAGEIISRVTGTHWGEHLEREVLGPLGLRRTVHCDARRVVPGRAETYVTEDGATVHAPYVSMRILGASGALCSTAGDLLRWSHLLHASRVVSPASLARMTARTRLSGGDTVDAGLGVYMESLGGHRKVFHGGTRPGGAYLAHYPDDGLTIAVLTNSASVGREKAAEVEEALARAAFGLEIPDLPLAAEDLARYEGAYTLQLGERALEVRVFAEDGRLRAQATGQGVLRLLHQGAHTFVAAQDKDIRLVFTVADGRAESLTLHQRGRAVPGPRKR
jgi:D-alanyl-D-alanine carboxypeptidase